MKTKINWFKLLSIAVLLIFVGLVAVCNRAAFPTPALVTNIDSQSKQWTDEPIQPIPNELDLNREKVALGEKLFSEPQLSKDNTISCASCHSFDLGGTDRKARSTGIDGQSGEVNAPTVFNAAYNFKQFWDGRAETLEEQIDGPTHSAKEMGSDWNEITEKLRQSPEYTAEFANLYPNGIQIENIKDAIAVFERSLTTPDSRFDQFLRGNQEVLTKEEKEGYRTFKSVGCISCHQGVNVGGNLFQEFGVMGDYFEQRGNITKADFGRFNVTNHESDKYVFKVPGLRNVEMTAPYFHDGSAKNLEEAVSVMSKYQLGRKLSVEEINSIVKFLKTLNGEYKRYK
jgi:cytochrome c peroxidase